MESSMTSGESQAEDWKYKYIKETRLVEELEKEMKSEQRRVAQLENEVMELREQIFRLVKQKTDFNSIPGIQLLHNSERPRRFSDPGDEPSVVANETTQKTNTKKPIAPSASSDVIPNSTTANINANVSSNNDNDCAYNSDNNNNNNNKNENDHCVLPDFEIPRGAPWRCSGISHKERVEPIEHFFSQVVFTLFFSWNLCGMIVLFVVLLLFPPNLLATLRWANK